MTVDTGRRWPSWLVVGLGAVLVALYAFTDHDGEVNNVVVWLAAVGQVAFVLLWATQRWWSSPIGRALMAKSASLAVILAASVWATYNGPLPLWMGRLLFGAVAASILGQLLALGLEIRSARRETRPPSGMPPRS